jgi:hydroxymethylpyrimidine/phosphomethylpyrimidine kinase
LTVAGSDSGGGAGVQADLKTFSALGVYGASALTALTAQNTKEVRGIHDVSPAFVALQIDAVLDDVGADAVKVGMLGRPGVIEAVADCLRRHGVRRVVLDPVMVAKGGAPLLGAGAAAVLRERLVPLATVLTPNLPEVGVLLDRPAPRTEPEIMDACKGLLALGPRSVVVKGGHLDGAESTDYFSDGATLLRLKAPRVRTANTHGTGCTFAAAVAAYLAWGLELSEAVRRAKEYVSAAIAAAATLRLGGGHGPVHHFYQFWPPPPGETPFTS